MESRTKPGRSSWRGRPDRYRGFAVLVVLWTLVLVAFIVARITATGRVELQISANVAANAVVSAAADGAVYHAIFMLSDPRPDHRWAPDGAARELQIGSARVAVRIENEAGRINPSLSSPELLDALMQAAGVEPETAADLADAITQWVGSARKLRKPDELEAEYRAAGLDYAPPETPLESIDEFIRVRGMDAAVLAAVRPHLSLFAPRDPDPAYADPVVAAAIATTNGKTFANNTGPLTLPKIETDNLIVRIIAVARGPGNAEARRTVIAHVGSAASLTYSILSWASDSEN